MSVSSLLSSFTGILQSSSGVGIGIGAWPVVVGVVSVGAGTRVPNSVDVNWRGSAWVSVVGGSAWVCGGCGMGDCRVWTGRSGVAADEFRIGDLSRASVCDSGRPGADRAVYKLV